MTKIKELLDEQGRTQVWLAKKIDKSTPTVHGYCTGRIEPSFKLLKKIAELLGASIEELIDVK